MGKARRIVFAIVLLVLLGGLAWEVLRPREKMYEGRPLSYWLKRQEDAKYGLVTPEKQKLREQADETIRQIGTNALPELLRMLRARD